MMSVYSRMVLRSKIVSAIRNFFDSLDFVEVETPILQNQAGGANAKTFDTHHNDYDMDMVMRIAVELDHKMIMAGGITPDL
jgi:lysyl-tRNA synthetase class 2